MVSLQKIAIVVAATVTLLAPQQGGADALSEGREIAWKAYRADTSRDASRRIIMVVERDGMRLVREMEMLTRKFPPGERTLIRFLAPPDVRNNKYLTWSWETPDRHSDMWMFMPAENLVRRISDGGKKSAFMRSDLANEDMEKRSVLADEEKLLGKETVDGVVCSVVEYLPYHNENSNYSKRTAWIREDNWNPARIEYYDKQGNLLKTAHYGGYVQIDGVWTYRKMLVETPRRKSRTLLEVRETRFNLGLPENTFEQGGLKR